MPAPTYTSLTDEVISLVENYASTQLEGPCFVANAVAIVRHVLGGGHGAVEILRPRHHWKTTSLCVATAAIASLCAVQIQMYATGRRAALKLQEYVTSLIRKMKTTEFIALASDVLSVSSGAYVRFSTFNDTKLLLRHFSDIVMIDEFRLADEATMTSMLDAGGVCAAASLRRIPSPELPALIRDLVITI